MQLSNEIGRRCKENPIFFFEEILGVNSLEQYQKDILNEIVNNDRVAISATHAVGKTFLMARVIPWFLFCYTDSIVISTAPTHRQVVTQLWGELRDAFHKSKITLGGHLTESRLKLSDKWFAMGYSPQKTASTSAKEQGSASSFQGFHAKHIMVIFDEAVGIPHNIWVQVEGLLTSGATVKFVAIGNPTTRSCDFFTCFSSPQWAKIYLSCFDSPNLKANGINNKQQLKMEVDKLKVMSEEKRLERIKNYKIVQPHLLNCQWVIPSVYKWGMEHPLTLSKIFGEFPLEEDNVIVQYADVLEAIAREYKIQVTDERYIGVDVARYGEDLSVITEIIGNKVTRVERMAKRDLVEVTGAVTNMIKSGEHQFKKTTVTVDATGLGSGVVDMLKQNRRSNAIGDHVQIHEVHFGATCDNPDDKSQYYNLKSKIFYELGSDVKDILDLPSEDIYIDELPTILYSFDSRGRIVIESKDDYKKRTGRGSPDNSDSLAIANYGKHVCGVGSFDDILKNKNLTRRSNSKDTLKNIQKRIKITDY